MLFSAPSKSGVVAPDRHAPMCCPQISYKFTPNILYDLTIPTKILTICHMGAALPLANPEFPLGQKGQRGAVLVQLKRSQPLTAKDLASRLGVSLNAVRHHLKELEVEGLVRYDRSHRGVGAPAFSYRLSFRWGGALSPALSGDPDRAARSDRGARGSRGGGRAPRDPSRAARARGSRLRCSASRPTSGWQRWRGCGPSRATWPKHVRGRPCSRNTTVRFRRWRSGFPEICAAEAKFLEEVLGAEVDRRGHILSGCAACEYHVRFKDS